MKLLNKWRHRPGFMLGASTSSKSKNNAAQRGIRYHRQVYKKLEAIYDHESGTKLHIEPWFSEISGAIKERMRSPDAVLIFPELRAALVIEVKLNYADGKDEKLINEYLPIVRSAFDLTTVWPVLICQCLRGCRTPPLLGLQSLEDAMSWSPSLPTPVLLQP